MFFVYYSKAIVFVFIYFYFCIFAVHLQAFFFFLHWLSCACVPLVLQTMSLGYFMLEMIPHFCILVSVVLDSKDIFKLNKKRRKWNKSIVATIRFYQTGWHSLSCLQMNLIRKWNSERSAYTITRKKKSVLSHRVPRLYDKNKMEGNNYPSPVQKWNSMSVSAWKAFVLAQVFVTTVEYYNEDGALKCY